MKSADSAERRKAVELLLGLAFGKESQFSEEALYLAAVQSYNEKKYGEAASIFTRYMKRYPEGKHAASVRTMTAWSNYLNGKFADAAALCGDGATDVLRAGYAAPRSSVLRRIAAGHAFEAFAKASWISPLVLHAKVAMPRTTTFLDLDLDLAAKTFRSSANIWFAHPWLSKVETALSEL